MCSKHDCLISLKHMDTSSYFQRTTEIRSYLADLKQHNIRDWEEDKQRSVLLLFKEVAKII